MSVQEGSVPLALPDRARPVRWGYYAIRVLLVAVLLAAAAFLPRERGPGDRYRYHEGDIARERIVAPYAFPVDKDEVTLRRQQEEAASSVPPVFVVDGRVSSEMFTRFSAFQDKALAIVLDPGISPDDRRTKVRALGVPLTAEAAVALSSPGRARRALDGLNSWLHHVYEVGAVSFEKRDGLVLGYHRVTVREGDGEVGKFTREMYDRREALAYVGAQAQDLFTGDPRGLHMVDEIAQTFIEPNVVYDRAETEWRRVQAQGVVAPKIGYVQKDELIVDANQRITRESLLKLRSLANLEASRRVRSDFLYPPVARMLLMLLFIAVFSVYLRIELPQVFRNNSMLALFTLLTVVVMGLAEVAVGVLDISEFVIPLALAPLVVASLLEKRPALMFTMILIVVATSVSGLRAPFVPVAAMGGVTAVYSVSHLRHRWHFARAFITISLANFAAILAWDLARNTPLHALLVDSGFGVINGFVAVALAFLLLPPIEHMFGLTSDITLLELSDLNRPLLKRMQLEAPGTYHHSMVVGSLAEAAAEAIGANSLLARVMAYYHDIGKLAKPEYFAENEFGTPRSLHERLAPSMSALIVRSHITAGLEMARKHRLPSAVLEAIPEHHGTMVMAFFFHKALEADPTVRAEEFSYPGPRPRSKETAILMLADGVEGSSRALAEPTPSRIRGLIARIFEERIQQGQLDECGLTLQELAGIREAFFPVVTAIFHVRAPYPEDPRRRRADADLRRESR